MAIHRSIRNWPGAESQPKDQDAHVLDVNKFSWIIMLKCGKDRMELCSGTSDFPMLSSSAKHSGQKRGQPLMKATSRALHSSQPLRADSTLQDRPHVQQPEIQPSLYSCS